jgi:ubiquitin-conjugating enzyme E2 J2
MWFYAWSFNWIFQNIKTELERRAEAERAARSNPQSVTANDMQTLLRNQFGNNDQSPLYSAITNICVIIGFAAFAYTVKYVLRSIATEWDHDTSLMTVCGSAVM